MLDPMLSAAETVKTTFQHTFKTGNIIWDTIINSIIIMFVGYATTWIGYVIRSISLERIKGTLLFCLGFRKQSISITGMITRTGDKHFPHFSQRFKAVLYKIKKLELAESKINGLKEIKIDNETDFFVNQTLYFQFAPQVYGSIWQYETQKAGQNGFAYTEELFMIEVYSWKMGLQELKDILETWETDYTQSFLKQTIKLTGKIMNDKYGVGIQTFEFSDRFFAVLHKIGTVDHGDTAPDLVELHIKEPGRANPYASAKNPETPMHKRKEVSRLVPKQFKFDENVSGEVDWCEDTENKSTVVYTISIHTSALSYLELTSMVSTWEKEYEDYKYSQNGLHFYSYNPVPESDGDDYNEFPFQSSKTFDNLFFSEKEKIVSRVKFFSENETWYAERGVPYTLGFLFHGLPGTGKTSSIKAIANMTQRHIVSVPLKNVKTIEDLYKVFYGSTINKKSIPINKRIFVLEDIDAASLEDTVKRRDEDQNKLEGDQDTDSDADTDKDEETGKAATRKKLKKELREKEKLDKKKLTLADLLEVFDGVMEMKGRIMVITTNHPEKLDRALIRPGRVDINMKFGYCQPDDILDIFRNFYGEQSIPAEFDRSLLPGNCWTAAEAIQVFLNNMDNPARGLEMICEASSIDQEKITLFQG